MTAEFYRVPPKEGYYLFWEKISTGYAKVVIGQYFAFSEDKNKQPCYFQVAGSEMDFRPEMDRKRDWFYGPLDIKVPELPDIPS